MIIDISKADKVLVLMELVNQADNSGAQTNPDVVALIRSLPKIDYVMAQRIASVSLDLDYVLVKSIKADLRGPTFDTWLYDRDNGEGAAGRALKDVPGVEFNPDPVFLEIDL